MTSCSSVMETPQLEVSYSGGGFRALQSAAVFRLVLQEEKVWDDVTRATGVSGGSWFIQTEQHPQGKLRGVFEEEGMDAERLVSLMKSKGLIPQFAPGQRQSIVENDCPLVTDRAMEVIKSKLPLKGVILGPVIKKLLEHC